MIRVSVVLPCYCRPDLLHWGLTGLATQVTSFDFEVLVINDGIDDETSNVCRKHVSSFRALRYYFSGQRNMSKPQPRSPGHALNVGIRRAAGEVVVVGCPESYLLTPNTLEVMSQPLFDGIKVMTGPGEILDDDGKFLARLVNSGAHNESTVDYLRDLRRKQIAAGNNPFIVNPKAPYFMAFPRDVLWQIGGYDENFENGGCEDNDLTGRMETLGYRFSFATEATLVHLFHTRLTDQERIKLPSYQRNWHRWKDQIGQPYRNREHEWGVI